MVTLGGSASTKKDGDQKSIEEKPTMTEYKPDLFDDVIFFCLIATHWICLFHVLCTVTSLVPYFGATPWACRVTSSQELQCYMDMWHITIWGDWSKALLASPYFINTVLSSAYLITSILTSLLALFGMNDKDRCECIFLAVSCAIQGLIGAALFAYFDTTGATQEYLSSRLNLDWLEASGMSVDRLTALRTEFNATLPTPCNVASFDSTVSHSAL